MVTAHAVGNFRQVADALGGHHGALAGGLLDGHDGEFAGGQLEALVGECRNQRLVEGSDAIVVETGRLGAENRHVIGRLGEQLPVSLDLLAHIAQGIIGPLAVEFVDGHEVGKIEHVDFFQLGSGAEFRSHDIQRNIDIGNDGGIALADTGSFDNDQIKTGQLAGGDDFRQSRGDFAAGIAGGQGAHENIRMLDGIHADAVTQQGAAGALSGRVDGDQADFHLVALVEAETANQFIGQGRLAGAAGAGNPQDRCGQVRSGLEQRLPELGSNAIFEQGDDPGELAPVTAGQGCDGLLCRFTGQIGHFEIGLVHDIVDHALQAHLDAVFRSIKAGYPVLVQLLDLGRNNDAAPAPENLDLTAAAFPEQIDHVLEELQMPPLIGGHGDALDVFLQGGVDDFLHRAVVSQMDDLGAGRLHDPSHDVDGRVMAVKKRGRGNEANLVLRLVRGDFLGDGKIGHGGHPVVMVSA